MSASRLRHGPHHLDQVSAWVGEALNPATPLERLLLLADLPETDVAWALLRNPEVPAEVLDHLARRDEFLPLTLLADLAAHPRTPLWAVVYLLCQDGAFYSSLAYLTHRTAFEAQVAISLWNNFESRRRSDLLYDHILRLSERLGHRPDRRTLALRLLPNYLSAELSSFEQLIDDVDMICPPGPSA